MLLIHPCTWNRLTTWPLELFVAREVIETYFFQGEYDVNRHLIFTSSLTVSSLIVSLAATDLGVVLEVTGGLSATALAFIFPAICFLKLTSEGKDAAPAGFERIDQEEDDEIQGDLREDDEDEERAGHAGDVSVEDVELPLRPGARVRVRRGPQRTRSDGWRWWTSTKPAAVACAIFGCVVLVISGKSFLSMKLSFGALTSSFFFHQSGQL